MADKVAPSASCGEAKAATASVTDPAWPLALKDDPVDELRPREPRRGGDVHVIAIRVPDGYIRAGLFRAFTFQP